MLWLSIVSCIFVSLQTSHAKADDWTQKSFKVAGGGSLQFEFPKSWGRKPAHNIVETITDIRFGPFGPREKPVFMVNVQSVLAADPINDEALLEIAEIDIANYKESTDQTDIPIKDLQGPNMIAHYFSITDQESKRGEFDYLTLAIIGSGRLLVKCYFFSSDGAPDFGADAIRMMQSVKYLAPVPKEKK